MRTKITIISVLALLAGMLTARSALCTGGVGEFRPDEVVCEMEPGFDVELINELFGTTIKGHQPLTDCYLLGTPPGQDAESLAVLIEATPGVLYCGANYYFDAPEPFQRSQPFLDGQVTGDIDSQLAVITLNLTEAHTLSTGTGVTIAVIDGGVNLDHPEFDENQIISRYDYVDSDSIAFDEPGGPCSGHGTFIAGILRLVAPDADIYAYRVLDTLGRGDGYTIAEAIITALEDGCSVINLSLGMVGVHDAVDEALKEARRQEVMVIAAAGNDSTDNNLLFPFPASRTYCITVAALDSMNLKADFSNYGTKIDVCAPGTRIYAPYLDTLYAWWDGTSFAAPFVGGLAALLQSIRPDITWEGIDSCILMTAISVDSLNPGFEGSLGRGLIDMTASLEMAGGLMCGDMQASNAIDIDDAVFLISYIFKGGSSPLTMQSADVDCSGYIDIDDVVYLVSYVFANGTEPCASCQ